MLAWPTMLQNVIGGLQGIVDHAMVGHFVGFTGNAAIGVSWQIFLVVQVFIGSLFTGMGVLVARFAGRNEPEVVNRVVYQAFLTAVILSLVILAPIGYFLAPSLLNLVNATAAVQAEALPYIRTLFVFSFGMMVFFMLGGALRSAGDARTPLRLGIWMTMLNLVLNVILIRGLGPIPAFGTLGAAMGTVIAAGIVAVAAAYSLLRGRWVIQVQRKGPWRPDPAIIRQLFRFGLPTGIQGVAMNIGGVILLRFIGSLQASAEAQAAYSVAYTQLFSLVTWTSVGIMGATAAVAGQNFGAGRPERSVQGARVASWIGIAVAAVIGAVFLLVPRAAPGWFRARRSGGGRPRGGTPRLPEYLGGVRDRRIGLYGRPAGHRGHSRSALHLTHLAVGAAAGNVLGDAGDRGPGGAPHLAGDPAGARHALGAERRALPAGALAADRGGDRVAHNRIRLEM